MQGWLIKRLVQVPVTLLVLITVAFLMTRVVAGSPFSDEQGGSEEYIQRKEAQYGLDQPLIVQYGRYLGGVVQGDLGPSFKDESRTVNEIIGDHLPTSLLLGFASLLVAVGVGVGAGIASALRHNGLTDATAMTAATLGLCLPAFVIGPLLQGLFGVWLGWFPIAGWDSQAPAAYLVLPALTLALPFAARIARLMRAGMLEALHQDHVRTARAKGLRESVVVLRHALRGGMLPVVSFLGPAVAAVLTGSLVVEEIFGVPGLGTEFISSANDRDLNLVLGTVLIYGLMLITANLLVDVAYGLIDPRIRQRG